MRAAPTGREPARSGDIQRGVSPLFLCLFAASWIVVLDNFAFWAGFMRGRPGSLTTQWLALAALAGVLVLLLAFLMRPLAGFRTGRWVIAGLLLLGAATAHFVDRWGVLVDKNLVTNILETDAREVRELLSWSMLADFLARGVLPAFLLLQVRVLDRGRKSDLLQTMALAGLTAAVTAGAFAALLGTYTTTFRNNRELRLQLVPFNSIRAVNGFLRAQTVSLPSALIPVAPDASKAPPTSQRPRVMVLVVGETARAANFSLGGYARDTNRALDGLGFTYFSKVRSCGTDTATSLPCMFSDIGSEGFSIQKAKARENVLDVMERSGIDVLWLGNNSGCKGVCARVPTRQMEPSEDPALCAADGCHDEVLLAPLQDALSTARGDLLIVLHLMGSHGPSYFKRYPAPGRFQPTCDTNRIQTCTTEALVNTYDNTIDYTSVTLARVLRTTQVQSSRLDTAVFYVSDHGESLGENDVYLHGLPSMFAPREQTEIPMMGWLSPGAGRSLGVGANCLSALAESPLSHDNLFHTLLGFYGVQTAAYRANLDVFSMAQRLPNCEIAQR